jgi:hypothetical protein
MNNLEARGVEPLFPAFKSSNIRESTKTPFRIRVCPLLPNFPCFASIQQILCGFGETLSKSDSALIKELHLEHAMSYHFSKMEPVTVTIVTALAAGAAAAAKDVATKAVKDAYSGLRKLIVDRYQKAAPFVEAVESNPTSEPEQKVLLNQLNQAHSDAEAKSLAVALLDALQELQNDPRAQAVFDFGKLRAAKNFELSDIQFSGTLLRASEATFEGDFKATKLRQNGPKTKPGK